jgi:exonuclease SbcC
MYIRALKLENFQSFQDAKLNFPNFKTIFITGISRDTGSSNGVGKSSIKEALLFALFGKSKVKGADIIRRGSKQSSVTVELEHDGVVLEVTRVRKQQVSNLSLNIGGQPQKGTQPELQDLINKTLGLDMETFITYSIIDKVRDTELSKLSSTDLRTMLQDMLGLGRLQHLLDNMGKDKNELSAYLSKVHVRHYPSQARHAYLDKIKETIRESLDSTTQSLIGLTSRLSTIDFERGQLDLTTRSLANKQKEIFSLDICPTCTAEVTTEFKMGELTKIQAEIEQNRGKFEALAIEKQSVSSKLSELQKALLGQNKVLFRCLAALTKLEESIKSNVDIAKSVEKQQLFVIAIDTVQKYITQALAIVATQIEDQMNAELGRFSDLFCKINLSKTTQQGQVLPNCYISIFRDQYEYTYDMLSSGEQALVSLIFKLVINNIKHASSLLFVDEGLDALDAINRERILSLLEASNYQQVFIISHREDSSYLKTGQRILLRKDDGVSTIVQV